MFLQVRRFSTGFESLENGSRTRGGGGSAQKAPAPQKARCSFKDVDESEKQQKAAADATPFMRALAAKGSRNVKKVVRRASTMVGVNRGRLSANRDVQSAKQPPAAPVDPSAQDDKAVLRAMQRGAPAKDAVKSAGRERRASEELKPPCTATLSCSNVAAISNELATSAPKVRKCSTSSIASVDKSSGSEGRPVRTRRRSSFEDDGTTVRRASTEDGFRRSSTLSIAELLADQMERNPEVQVDAFAVEQDIIETANFKPTSKAVEDALDPHESILAHPEALAENLSRSIIQSIRSALTLASNLTPVFDPFSRIRLAWDAVLVCASCATLALMPVAWAFPNSATWVRIGEVTGGGCCFAFFFNILVKLRTAVLRQGMLNRNPTLVARQYALSSSFLTDVVTALAYPIQMATSPHAVLLHLVALRHILTCASTFERAAKASYAARRVLILLISSLCLVHWVACTWSMLADTDKSTRAWLRSIPANASSEEMPDSWFTLYQAQLHAPPPPTDEIIYLYAVYWTLASVTTIGFGDVVPANELELGVICITIGVSAVLYTALIAYMSNLILAADVNWTAHKQKVETIKSYMRHRKIPSDLVARIDEYLDYLWATQKGIDEADITSMLPATLQRQLSLYCNSRIISQVPLFAGVPSHVSAAIVMQLQPRIFVPDDMIISQGDWADEMFLIYRGVVKLVELSEQEGRGIYLKDGDYFGEIAVLTGGKRMMSVRAVTYCHLYSLQQRLLERILQQYPECIDNLLVNMMDTYENFEEIKAQIFALAGAN
jgi:hypothetical protein